eukprot:s70_g8.t1
MEAGDTASLTKAFGDCDDALRKALSAKSEAGTTATLARVQENGSDDSLNVLVANLGDSRALLWRPTGTLEVTRDHRPGDAAERARIEAAGGTVSEEERIDGTLACSRALGAFRFKGATPSEPSKVSCVPEVYHWTAKRGDWLILACDGIWDTISNQQAVDRICKVPGDLGELLESVLHFCIDREADDNLTLLAVELGAVQEESATACSVSAGGFLKTKDSEVLEQYALFCQRFGYSIQKEMRPKGPPVVKLSKVDPCSEPLYGGAAGGYSADPAGALTDSPAGCLDADLWRQGIWKERSLWSWERAPKSTCGNNLETQLWQNSAVESFTKQNLTEPRSPGLRRRHLLGATPVALSAPGQCLANAWIQYEAS